MNDPQDPPAADSDFVDFKGWRFRPPFRCMCCGVIVSLRQFCFGRTCGSCDLGHCRHHKLEGSQRRHYSGPREMIDRNDKYFIPEDKWFPVAELPAMRLPEQRPRPYRDWPPRHRFPYNPTKH